MFLFHVIDLVIPIPNLEFFNVCNDFTDIESPILNFSGQFLSKNEAQNTEFEWPGFFMSWTLPNFILYCYIEYK